MNDKKNIDRYFQEQFKDFEAVPDPQVWESIEYSLRQRKKRRKAIPFWFKITGTAAALLVGLLIIQKFENSPLQHTIKVVDQSKGTQKGLQDKKILPKQPIHLFPHGTVNKQQVVTNQQPNQPPYEKETIRATRSKINSNQKKNKKDFIVHIQENNPSVTTLATTTAEKNSVTLPDETSATTNKAQNTWTIPANKTLVNSEHVKNKSTLTDATASTTTNTLEEILKNKENPQEISKAKGNKWKITPTVAALYLNTNARGSALDPQLAENKKTNDNSLSLGIGVHYALNPKLNLRSGINRLAMSYNTTNVSYTAGLRSNTLTNINYTGTSAIEITTSDSRNTLSSFEKNLQKNNVGTLSQHMNYFEIPFEMSYTVVQKKLGVHLIAGFSTLILNNNEVRLESNAFHETIGSATNLNSVHFSTNIGFGVHYKLIKSFQVNLEPMLKYQINTFTNNSSDFKPVVLGVYTGISYGF